MRKTVTFFCLILSMMLVLPGCSSQSTDTASVQSVRMLCGLGNPNTIQRFSGIVSARGEESFYADTNKTIKEILVEEGERVSEGQTLFTYDAELMELELEKAKLEIQQLQASVTAKEKEKAELEERMKYAAASDQLSYTLEISECETEIRETNYNITLKQRSLDYMEESMGDMEVVSTLAGKVQKINKTTGYDSSGNALAVVTIVEEGEYRVKGMVNENNIDVLSEGMAMTIRSRRDAQKTWTGELSYIDWENPSSSGSSSYLYENQSDDLSSSSRYPFYVELDSAEGLLLGEHVYIEPYQESSSEDRICLPSSYLVDMEEDSAYVWIESDHGKLKKQKVTLGEYLETEESYVIVAGLTIEDYIACPQENLTEGMPCVEYRETTESEDSEFSDGEATEDLVENPAGGSFQ